MAAVVELLQSGEEEADAKRFVETVAWHPAAWDASEMREVFVCNAPTFLGEAHDRDWQRIDVEQPSRFEPPALLTKGTVSPPFFAALVDTIGGAPPQFRIETIESTDHTPHQTTADRYIALTRRFVEAAMSCVGAGR